MKRLIGIILPFIICLTLHAQLYNGDFEIRDPNENNRTPPGWTSVNYAFTHYEFTPKPENRQILTWSVETILPYSGENFVVLSTGDIGRDSTITIAHLSTTFTAEAGKTLVGCYFFGTCDYTPFNDYGNITIAPALDQDNIMELVRVEVKDVNSYSSLDGWKFFSHTFTEADAGEYVFTATVEDIDDDVYKSYLLLDNINVIDTPPACDFNPDLQIDLKDFAVLANHWGDDCSDPNNHCEFTNMLGEIQSVDYNNDGVIDELDIIPLAENWLWRSE